MQSLRFFNSTEKQPFRRRWRWHLLGLALGTLLGVLALPATNRLVRQQFALAFPGVNGSPGIVTLMQVRTSAALWNQVRLEAAASELRADAAAQVAHAILLGNSQASPPPENSPGVNYSYEEARTSASICIQIESVVQRFPSDPLS